MNHRPFRHDGHLNQQSAVGEPVFPPKKGEKDPGTEESIPRATYAVRIPRNIKSHGSAGCHRQYATCLLNHFSLTTPPGK